LSDRLQEIFTRREEFMHLIKEKYQDAYPNWPLNISEKQSQTVIRETLLKGVEEMFEALVHLKNWKPHRETEVPEIDKDAFLEEIVDSFNYFFSLIILCGITPDEFFDNFLAKDEIIRRRIKQGY
jgi:hypothetical protein